MAEQWEGAGNWDASQWLVHWVESVDIATWDVGEDGSGYLVLRVGWHKTSNLSQKKRVLLPLIVPLLGVDGLPFGNELWQVFNELGIRFEERWDKPFLSPYMRDGDEKCPLFFNFSWHPKALMLGIEKSRCTPLSTQAYLPYYFHI